jgi:DNA replication protein DnaC
MSITPDRFIKVVKAAEERDKGLDFINQRIDCPPMFRDATPDKLNKKIKKFLTSDSNNLNFFLYGGVGTGKTYSAYAIAKLYFVNKMSVRLYNYIDLLTQIKESFGKPGSDDFIKEKVCSQDAIILDDLGAEKVTEWTLEILYRLIDHRYINMIPLIIISNLNIEDLSKIYGDRIMSRIVGIMGDNIIKFTGKDRRLG